MGRSLKKAPAPSRGDDAAGAKVRNQYDRGRRVGRFGGERGGDDVCRLANTLVRIHGGGRVVDMTGVAGRLRFGNWSFRRKKDA